MQDTLQQAMPKKKKNTVIFEINDTGRDEEYTPGSDYFKSFVGFIESLGYEVKASEGYRENKITIKGVELNTDNTACSTWAYHPYGREWKERKPQNRFMLLSYFDNSVRIHINKEIDGDSLRRRIDALIQLDAERNRQIEEYETIKYNNTKAVGEHYLSVPGICTTVSMICIEKSIIQFHTDGPATIYINADGTFNKVTFYTGDINTRKDLDKQVRSLMEASTFVGPLVDLILKHPKLPAHIIDWTKDAYYQRYDVRKKKVDKD